MLINLRNALMAGKRKPYWGLYFEAEEANCVVNMTTTGTPAAATFEVSPDGLSNWTSFDPANGVTLAAIGDRVYFRAGAGGNTSMASGTSAYRTFTLSKKAKSGGSIMSLLNGTNANLATVPSYGFARLFRNCAKLTSAPLLPATTIGTHCYRDLFYGCTLLTEAPELPAMTAPDGCYREMFEKTGLIVAPDLPATTIGSLAYYMMFGDCAALTTSMARLPATTLAAQCYTYMFNSCKNLETFPELPATSLANNCYEAMFARCSKMTQAPALNATTLANNCYSNMFLNCTSLAQSPHLPATSVPSASSYNAMFNGCTSLATVSVALQQFPTGGFTNWLNNVAANGTFNCPQSLGTGATIERGVNYCPNGWTVENA